MNLGPLNINNHTLKIHKFIFLGQNSYYYYYNEIYLIPISLLASDLYISHTQYNVKRTSLFESGMFLCSKQSSLSGFDA